MDLSEYEKLALPSTGLVPMEITRSFTPYAKGDTAGFHPAVAMSHHQDGFAVPLKPDGSPAKIKQAAQAKQAEQKAESLVEIPENWQELHHLPLIAIAEKITGQKVAKKDDAIAVIEAELARRAGAAQD